MIQEKNVQVTVKPLAPPPIAPNIYIQYPCFMSPKSFNLKTEELEVANFHTAEHRKDIKRQKRL